MKYFYVIFCCLFSAFSFSQKPSFIIHTISLPAEISYYDNQFSGLYVHDEKLFLMSESRLQDDAEGKLYAIRLTDLNHKLVDTSFVLPWQKYPLYNLEILRNKMTAAGDDYEGLEAIVINGNDVYLSVETATPSNNCYLLKGKLSDTAVVLYPYFLIPMAKPVNTNGKHIYNAGYEAMAFKNNSLFTFFEYNYFNKNNEAKMLNDWSFQNNGKAHTFSMQKLPFRITDITQTNAKHFTAINYFYKGEGADTIYRVPTTDTKFDKFIRDKNEYHNYCRLIDISFNNGRFTWQPLWEFPAAYSSYNWEGIAAYKKGYFIINDKYTAARPYYSTLLYLEKK